jgi:hypothetical protein
MEFKIKRWKKAWIFSSLKRKEVEEWLNSLEVKYENTIQIELKDEDENFEINL